jgi:anti-anti-sigma regulatory factor
MENMLRCNIEQKEGAVRVGLTGDLSGDEELKELLPPRAKVMIFDLAEVRRIKSTGVRAWMNLVQELEKSGVKMVLERCSVATLT